VSFGEARGHIARTGRLSAQRPPRHLALVSVTTYAAWLSCACRGDNIFILGATSPPPLDLPTSPKSTAAKPNMAEEVPAVNLRILSPSTELQGGLSFPNLPAATTIQELRTRIQDTAPSKPAPDRMRLIYRGRVIANDADTLATVFGAESVSHCVGDVISSMADPDRCAKPRTRASTSSSASCRPLTLLLHRLLHGP
jgi:hypothetical protein